MEGNPLAPDIVFHLGVIPISRAVATTWVIMAALTALFWFGLRNPKKGSPLQTAAEILVETLEDQIRQIAHRDPAHYLPLLGTLFIFLVVANLSAVLPGVKPPTGHLETPAALALIVFFSVHVFGLQAQGLRPYLRHYLKPNILMTPLNILSELTRTLSLMVRLFGNMMSHEIMLAIISYLAGLLLPVPFLLLGVLIGLIQAYIFTVLAAVYIGAATGGIEAG